MARIEYPGSSGSNKLGALAGNYVSFPFRNWSVLMELESSGSLFENNHFITPHGCKLLKSPKMVKLTNLHH